jgi:hypothetical protein
VPKHSVVQEVYWTKQCIKTPYVGTSKFLSSRFAIEVLSPQMPTKSVETGRDFGPHFWWSFCVFSAKGTK